MENNAGGGQEFVRAGLLDVSIRVNGEEVSARDMARAAVWLGRVVVGGPSIYIVGGHISNGVTNWYSGDYSQAINQFIHAGLWLTAAGVTEVGGRLALGRMAERFSGRADVDEGGMATEVVEVTEVGRREREEFPDY